MAFVYDRVVVGTELSCQPNAYLIDNQRGSLLTANGTTTVALAAPASNGLVLTSDVSNVDNTQGLVWKAINPADLDLSGLAGSGLSFQNGNLAIRPSSTISVITGDVSVRSDATTGRPLLSTGSTTASASYGPLNLAATANTTGALPIARGGTGVATLPADSILTTDSAGAVTGTSLAALLPTIATVTTTQFSLTATTTILQKTLTTGQLHYLNADLISVGSAGNNASQASFTLRVTIDYTTSTPRIVGLDTSFTPTLTGQRATAQVNSNSVLFLVGGQPANWKIRLGPILSQAIVP